MSFKTAFLISGFITTNIGVAQAAPVRKIVPKGKTAYKSSTYRFAIWLPLKPTLSQEVSDVAIFQSDTPTVTYGVNVQRNPFGSKIPSRSQASLFFDKFQTTLLRNTNGTLQGQRELQLGNYPGRSIGLNREQGQLTMFGRSYFTSRFLYQITASVSTRHVRTQAAQINRVFDSFRILPQ